jgi:thioredoxin 1
MIEITADNHHDITKEGICFLDFSAPWCGPCRAIMPLIEKMSGDYPDVTFGTVDCDEEPELAAEYMVQGVPSFFVLKDGKAIESSVGNKGMNVLTEMLEKHLEATEEASGE